MPTLKRVELATVLVMLRMPIRKKRDLLPEESDVAQPGLRVDRLLVRPHEHRKRLLVHQDSRIYSASRTDSTFPTDLRCSHLASPGPPSSPRRAPSGTRSVHYRTAEAKPSAGVPQDVCPISATPPRRSRCKCRKRTMSQSRAIRWSDDIWTFICNEATANGESAATFVREAAIARAAFNLARREPDRVEEWSTLYVRAGAIIDRLDG